jgi:hypothetical protein
MNTFYGILEVWLRGSAAARAQMAFPNRKNSEIIDRNGPSAPPARATTKKTSPSLQRCLGSMIPGNQ